MDNVPEFKSLFRYLLLQNDTVEAVDLMLVVLGNHKIVINPDVDMNKVYANLRVKSLITDDEIVEAKARVKSLSVIYDEWQDWRKLQKAVDTLPDMDIA